MFALQISLLSQIYSDLAFGPGMVFVVLPRRLCLLRFGDLDTNASVVGEAR